MQERSERVVFHPDYTYSDFVGQILPRVVKDKLKYVFEPGPFTKMLKKANDDPDNMYYLVIEEINRGNTPAIFGDIFQLLDRNDDGSGKHKLIIDPEAAAVVREIFDMAIAKMRLIDMARTLNERGVETPGQYYRRKHPGTKKFINSSDKACWTHANLRTILKQEMYYGAIVGHKRQGIIPERMN